MATLGNLLKNEIYALIDADTDLDGSIDGAYFGDAPGTAGDRYIVYSILSPSHYTKLGSGAPRATDVIVVFDIYTNDTVSTNAETIQGYLFTLFDDKQIDVTGYKKMRMRRMSDNMIKDKDTGLWHGPVVYDCVASPN